MHHKNFSLAFFIESIKLVLRVATKQLNNRGKKMDQALNNIAAKTLNLETLTTRNSDELDFHDMSVWQIKEALEQAYRAGKAAGIQA